MKGAPVVHDRIQVRRHAAHSDDEPRWRQLVARLAQGSGSWRLGGAAVAASGLVLAIVAGIWLLRSPKPPVEAALPYAVAPTTLAPTSPTTLASGSPAPAAPAAAAAATAATAAAGTTPSDGTLVVHVAGAVMTPGVYALAAGARVDDAVRAAGGPGPAADVDAVNLAEPLRDGQRVYVVAVGESVPPMAGPSGAAPAAAADASVGPVGPVDLNHADVAALDALPGVGPSTAAAIVAHREANGPFASVDELEEVRGIGPAKLEALRGLVTV